MGYSKDQKILLAKFGSERIFWRFLRVYNDFYSHSTIEIVEDGVKKRVIGPNTRRYLYLEERKAAGESHLTLDDIKLEDCPNYAMGELKENQMRILAGQVFTTKEGKPDTKRVDECIALFTVASIDLEEINKSRKTRGLTQYTEADPEKANRLGLTDHVTVKFEDEGVPNTVANLKVLTDYKAKTYEYRRTPLDENELYDLKRLILSSQGTMEIVADQAVEAEEYPDALNDHTLNRLADPDHPDIEASYNDLDTQLKEVTEEFFDAKEVETERKYFEGQLDKKDKVRKFTNSDDIYYDDFIAEYLSTTDPKDPNKPRVGERVFENEVIDIQTERKQILHGLLMLQDTHISPDDKEKIWKKVRVVANRRVNFMNETMGGLKDFYDNRVQYEGGMEELNYLQWLVGVNGALDNIGLLGKMYQMNKDLSEAALQRDELDYYAKQRMDKDYFQVNTYELEDKLKENAQKLKELHDHVEKNDEYMKKLEQKTLKDIEANNKAYDNIKKDLEKENRKYEEARQAFVKKQAETEEKFRSLESQLKQDDLDLNETAAKLKEKEATLEKETLVRQDQLWNTIEETYKSKSGEAQSNHNASMDAAKLESENKKKKLEDDCEKNIKAAEADFQKSIKEADDVYAKKNAAFDEKTKDYEVRKLTAMWSSANAIPFEKLTAADAKEEKALNAQMNSIRAKREELNRLVKGKPLFYTLLDNSDFADEKKASMKDPANLSLYTNLFEKTGFFSYFKTSFATKIKNVDDSYSQISKLGNAQYQLIQQVRKLRSGEGKILPLVKDGKNSKLDENDIREQTRKILADLKGVAGNNDLSDTKSNMQKLLAVEDRKSFEAAVQDFLNAQGKKLEGLLKTYNDRDMSADADIKARGTEIRKILRPYSPDNKEPVSVEEVEAAQMNFHDASLKDEKLAGAYQEFAEKVGDWKTAKYHTGQINQLVRVIANNYVDISSGYVGFFNGTLEKENAQISNLYTEVEADTNALEKKINDSIKQRIEDDYQLAKDEHQKDMELNAQTKKDLQDGLTSDTKKYEKERDAAIENLQNELQKKTDKLQKEYAAKIKKLQTKRDDDRAKVDSDVKKDKTLLAIKEDISNLKSQQEKQLEAQKSHTKSFEQVQKDMLANKKTKLVEEHAAKEGALEKKLAENIEAGKDITWNYRSEYDIEDGLKQDYTPLIQKHDKQFIMLNSELPTMLKMFEKPMKVHDNILKFWDLKDKTCLEKGIKPEIKTVKDLEAKTNISASLRNGCSKAIESFYNTYDVCRYWTNDSDEFKQMVSSLAIALGKEADPKDPDKGLKNAFKEGTLSDCEKALKAIKNAASNYLEKKKRVIEFKTTDQREYRLNFAKNLVKFAETRLDKVIPRLKKVEADMVVSFDILQRGSDENKLDVFAKYNNNLNTEMKKVYDYCIKNNFKHDSVEFKTLESSAQKCALNKSYLKFIASNSERSKDVVYSGEEIAMLEAEHARLEVSGNPQRNVTAEQRAAHLEAHDKIMKYDDAMADRAIENKTILEKVKETKIDKSSLKAAAENNVLKKDAPVTNKTKVEKKPETAVNTDNKPEAAGGKKPDDKKKEKAFVQKI